MTFDLSHIEALLSEAKTVAIDAYRLGQAGFKIRAGVKDGKTFASALVEDAPEVLPIVESIANLVFPGSGTAIELIAAVVAAEKPQTQEQVNTWMDRFGAGSVS